MAEALETDRPRPRALTSGVLLVDRRPSGGLAADLARLGLEAWSFESLEEAQVALKARGPTVAVLAAEVGLASLSPARQLVRVARTARVPVLVLGDLDHGEAHQTLARRLGAQGVVHEERFARELAEWLSRREDDEEVAPSAPPLDDWLRHTALTVPMEALLTVDYHALARELPTLSDDLQGLVRLFDGRRTVADVVCDASLAQAVTLDATTRLFLQGVLTRVKPPTRAQPEQRPAPTGFLREPTPDKPALTLVPSSSSSGVEAVAWTSATPAPLPQPFASRPTPSPLVDAISASLSVGEVAAALPPVREPVVVEGPTVVGSPEPRLSASWGARPAPGPTVGVEGSAEVTQANSAAEHEHQATLEPGVQVNARANPAEFRAAPATSPLAGHEGATQTSADRPEPRPNQASATSTQRSTEAAEPGPDSSEELHASPATSALSSAGGGYQGAVQPAASATQPESEPEPHHASATSTQRSAEAGAQPGSASLETDVQMNARASQGEVPATVSTHTRGSEPTAAMHGVSAPTSHAVKVAANSTQHERQVASEGPALASTLPQSQPASQGSTTSPPSQSGAQKTVFALQPAPTETLASVGVTPEHATQATDTPQLESQRSSAASTAEEDETRTTSFAPQPESEPYSALPSPASAAEAPQTPSSPATSVVDDLPPMVATPDSLVPPTSFVGSVPDAGEPPEISPRRRMTAGGLLANAVDVAPFLDLPERTDETSPTSAAPDEGLGDTDDFAPVRAPRAPMVIAAVAVGAVIALVGWVLASPSTPSPAAPDPTTSAAALADEPPGDPAGPPEVAANDEAPAKTYPVIVEAETWGTYEWTPTEEVASPPSTEPADKPDVSAPLKAATALYEAGRLREAGASLQRLLDATPSAADAWVLLGQVRYDSGDVKGARAAADRALAAEPGNAKVQLLLATMAMDVEDSAGARKALEQYLALEPSGENAAEARALLKRLGSKS